MVVFHNFVTLAGAYPARVLFLRAQVRIIFGKQLGQIPNDKTTHRFPSLPAPKGEMLCCFWTISRDASNPVSYRPEDSFIQFSSESNHPCTSRLSSCINRPQIIRRLASLFPFPTECGECVNAASLLRHCTWLAPLNLRRLETWRRVGSRLLAVYTRQ